MSRIGYSDEEEYPGQFDLWQANCYRSLDGKKGQAALRELEAALVALPDKRLIDGHLANAEGDVCAIGALAKYKGRLEEFRLSEPDHFWGDERDSDYVDDDMEGVGVALGMPRLVAWKVVELNDIEIDSHSVRAQGPPVHYQDRVTGEFRPYRTPYVLLPYTPEERYEKVLAWVREQIKKEESS